MKNEKLEFLLNKVVEINKPNELYCKGFLYKDNNGYYVKVVETLLGSLVYNDKYYLKTGDEQYVTQADKPKLMRISLKSWHYQLMKFVLRSKTPTPKTMQNGCPYFWLLIFTLFACPFVALWKVAKFLVLLIPKVLFWGLEKIVDFWLMSIGDEEAYEYYWNGKYNNSEFKMPVTAKLFFDGSDEDFMDYYLLEKYKLKSEINPEEYQKKREELKAKWDVWREERRKARAEKDAKRQAELDEIREREYEYMRRKAIRKAKWDARTKPIENGIASFFRGIRKAFTFKGDLKSLIRRTKQIVGALVTLILLGATYFVVNGLVLGLTYFIDFSIEYWYVYVIIIALAVVIGIIYILYLLFTGWAQSVINKYQGGKKVWYIEPFKFILIYFVYYPLKYVVLGIAYGLFYLIGIPLKYIFYNFLWKHVLVPFAKWIWKVLCALGRGIANSTGVFGEYFSASYTDYCPGIEWVDVPEEE
jgi:hypothetical protein